MAEEKKYKSKKEALSNGAILEAFTTKQLLSVNVAPDIEKVRFSIVALKTNGKDALDYYLSVEEMRQLCEEITNGAAYTKLKNGVKNQYPSTYKYVTGDNGSKHLNIDGGDKGIRVQVMIDKTQKMTVIPYTALKEMAFYFNLVTGLTPCSRYYKEQVDAFWEGVAERRKRVNASQQ